MLVEINGWLHQTCYFPGDKIKHCFYESKMETRYTQAICEYTLRTEVPAISEAAIMQARMAAFDEAERIIHLAAAENLAELAHDRQKWLAITNESAK